MNRFTLTHHPDLPADVIMSVQGVTKAPRLPLPQPPRWLARFLPGVEWSSSATAQDDSGDGDDGDDGDDFDDFDPEERSSVAFKEFSFDVPAGGGLGLVGPDFEVTQSLLQILSGFVPPSTGRILVRGRIAPLLKVNILNISNTNGKKAVAILGTFLGWPRDMLKGEKWQQIVDFARIDEISDEYEPGSAEHKKHATRRLLQSAVLHLDDVAVYVVGYNFYRAAPEFEARCYDLLEQRQREGCAIIQNGVEVEDVSRLCREAILVDAGEPLFRGRLGEVARFAHDRAAEEEETKALPLRALLQGEDGVELGGRGGRIEIELDVFSKKKLDLALAIQFTADSGQEVRIEQPDSFVAPKPGIYRLRVDVPGGLLGDASYKAVLFAGGANGKSDKEQALISFDVVSRSFGEEAADNDMEQDIVFSGSDDVGDESTDEENGVRWNVRRLTG